MAIKHQADCFRTIQGQRYINACDVLSDEDAALVAKAKERHIPHRLFKHSDGFSRLFVLESRANELWN